MLLRVPFCANEVESTAAPGRALKLRRGLVIQMKFEPLSINKTNCRALTRDSKSVYHSVCAVRASSLFNGRTARQLSWLCLWMPNRLRRCECISNAPPSCCSFTAAFAANFMLTAVALDPQPNKLLPWLTPRSRFLALEEGVSKHHKDNAGDLVRNELFATWYQAVKSLKAQVFYLHKF